MGKESKKHSDNKKIEEKNCINNKKYDSYNIHDCLKVNSLWTKNVFLIHY